MANPFDQFDSAKPSSNPFDQFDETPAKPSGALRKAIGDKVVGFASGAVGATKALADAAGAGNTVSNALDSANNTVNDYLSPEEKASQQARSARTEQAKGTGAWNEFKTGVQNFAESPIQQIVTGVGSVVPVAIAALGGLPAAAATGIGMGVGTVKGRIYDDTKKRSIDAGLSASDAEAEATKAQDYTGENADQIALGGALGAADALTGVGRIAGGALRNAVMKPAVSALPKAVERGVVGRAAMGALGEVPLEAAQGGQEQLATNIAAQRQGVNVDTWSGVAGQATEEGLASLGAGAGAGALHSGPKAPPTVPPVAPTADPLKIGNTPDPYISFPDGTVARRSEVESYVNSLPADQQPAARAKMMGLEPQPGVPEPETPSGPPAQLGYSQLAGTPTIHPDGTVTLNGEQEFQRRTQSQPAKPSEQMGLTPTDGPSLTNAAILAVDTVAPKPVVDPVDAAREEYRAQTAALLQQQDEQAYQAYMDAIEQSKVAQDELPGETIGVLSQLNDANIPDIFGTTSNASEEDFLRAMGATDQEIADAITNQPSSTQTSSSNPIGTAQNVATSAGAGAVTVDAKQANLDRIRKANNVSPDSGVQPISATSGGQDGNNAPASVGSGGSDANGLGANAAGSKPSGVGRSGEHAGGVPDGSVTIGTPITIGEGSEKRTITYRLLKDGRIQRTIQYAGEKPEVDFQVNDKDGIDAGWVSNEGYASGDYYPGQFTEKEAADHAKADANSMGHIGDTTGDAGSSTNVKNPAPTASGTQAQATPDQAPQAVAGDATPAGKLPGAGSATVQANGLNAETPASKLEAKQRKFQDAKFSLDTHGWDSRKLANSYDMEQLNQLYTEVKAQFSNKTVNGSPVTEDGMATKSFLDDAGTQMHDILKAAQQTVYDRKKASEAKAKADAAPAVATDFNSKQIPDMTDAELREARAFYPADHKRSPKIAKEINRRALVAKLKPNSPNSPNSLDNKPVSQPQEQTSAKTTEAQQIQAQPEAGTTASIPKPAAVATGTGKAEGVSKSILATNGPHFASGVSDFKAGKPRTLPSYFTKATGKNAKDWYRGWDAANVSAPEGAISKSTLPSSPEAVSAQGEGLNDHIRALRAVAHTGIKAGGPKGDVRLSTNPDLYVSFDDAVAEARKAVASGTRPVPFQIHNALDIGIGETDRVIAALDGPATRETITPSDDKNIGVNLDGNQLYERIQDEGAAKAAAKIDSEYARLIDLKGTVLMVKHPDGRALYEVKLSPNWRIQNMVGQAPFQRFPASKNFEVKGKADVTGNVSDNGYVLIDKREQNASREAKQEPRADGKPFPNAVDRGVKVSDTKPTPAPAEPAPVATESVAKTEVKANTIFTEDAAAAARARLKAKLGRLNSGIDPEMLMDGIILSGYHIEKGARTFAAYAKAMIGDLGDGVKPYLKSWYMATKYDPRAASIDGMDDAATMDAVNLDEVGAQPEKTGSLTEQLSAEILKNNMPKDNPALKKLVEAFDGKPADQNRMKEAQEALESAIVAVSRGVVAKNEGMRSTFDALLRLYQSQPNLNIRTSTSIANQAYSTPAPLAYLGSVLADVTPKTTMYEPTGGNGMLTINALPKNVTVNELEHGRIASLKEQGFGKVLEGDALKAEVAPKSQDRVMTNPPFGSVKDGKGEPTKVPVDGYKIGQIDHLIAARALDTLKDDGKATLIIGANKIAGGVSTDDRIFFNWLYGNYNVTSHFELDGDLYNRQGAGWPVRVITLNGRAKSDRVSPVAGTIQRAQNWEQVYEHFTASLDSNRTESQQGAVASPGGASIVQTGQGSVPKPAIQPTAKDSGLGQARSTVSDGNVPGASPGTVIDSPERTDGQLGAAVGEQRLNAESVESNRLDPAGDAVIAAPAKPAGSAGATALSSAENQFQVTYEPRSSRKDGGVLIPVNMKDPTQDALSRLEDAVGDIDDYATKELGYDSKDKLHEALMGLQVDSVASAIYQIEQGKGVVIADQTGIGKGRQAAAVIRWAERKGYIPVFVSVKPSLFTDMFGDLHDIGSDNISPFILNKDESIKGPGDTKLFANRAIGHRQTIERIRDSGKLPDGSNAIFMTYSQVNTDNVQRQMLTALADRAVFILDESHNAGGQSNTGEFVTSLLEGAKGVTYLSATYAKRPDNMPLYFKTDIGQAAADNEGLMQAMSNGGLPLQTVVSNNLVKAGQMFRRERSYDGVSIRTIADTEHRVEHEKLSDETTKALRAIVSADRMFHHVFVKQMNKDMQQAGGAVIDNAGNQAQAGVDHTQFSSVVHNFVKQMLLGLKAQRAADDAIATLKRGEKPIIAVENTMGSFLEAYAKDNSVSQGGTLGTFDYRTVLSRALHRTLFITEVKPNGEKVKKEIPLSQLDAETRAAYDHAKQVIDGLKLDIPVSPIDWMRNEISKAGFNVAEITGRKLAVDYSNKKNPVLGSIDTLEQTDKVRTTQLFNSGRLDALILNVAGSTGISLHASEKFEDQRPRHMIIAQAAGDINIFMQMLGRIHRTGQVTLPSYSILSVDLPTEKRPTAVLSGKMKSLNANTSSNTDSATSIKTVDMFNKYGDQVVAQYLQDNYALARDLGVEDLISGEDASEHLAQKATGRLALQPISVQNSFYDEVEGQYSAMMEYLNKTNQNDLEPRTFDYDAKETRQEVLFSGENKDSPFGEDAIYGEYSIKAQGKAMTPAEIREAMNVHLDGKNADAHMRATLEPLVKQFDAYIGTLEVPAHDSANATRATGQAFMVNHSIGDTFRVDINGDSFNAVVTNIRNTHKASGNPFSLSKIQVTIALNGALRSISVPASQFQKIEVSQIGRGYTIEQLFKEQPANQRETSKIVTGNLLAAYGELQGVRGTIITFTKQDGTTEQGILLPKAFDFKNNTRGDYRLPTGEDALTFLQKSENKDIARFGIQSRDGIVRVLPHGQGVSVFVPKSKLKGGKFFLDKGLIEVMGDFVSSGSSMRATAFQKADAIKALDLLMKKNALYAIPSMAEEAKALTGSTDADPAAFSRPRFSRGAQSQANESVTRLATGIASHWENAPKVVVAFDMNDPAIPESVRNEDQRQRSGGATGTPEGFYYKGTVYLMSSKLGTPNDIARVLFHESLGHYGLRGLFGKSLKPILNEISMRRRADVDAKIKQYGLKMGNKLDRFTAAEEVLAELAQTRPEIGIVQRAIAAIRTWLRENVPGFNNMRLSDNELIQNYILPARAWVEHGGPGGGGGLPAMSRTEDSQSPAFKKWFGNSKVVDADGQPLVVYHGTAEDISAFSMEKGIKFDPGYLGEGFYFSSSTKTANFYSNNRPSTGKADPNVMPVYLSIKNPYMAKVTDKTDGMLWGMKADGAKARRAELIAQGYDGVILDFKLGGWANEVEYVAFHPEQIKSAIGNNGDFDSQNPDIRFSRSIGDTLTSAANSARDVNLPAGYKVGDLFNSVPGKLNWWHKTVGTQYNLAQRSKPFKRVYDSVQNFINGVSYFATEAADLAPNILPKLESWKDIAKSPLSAEDTQALSKPVFEGTLTWARDESGKPVKMTVLEDAAAKLTPEQKAQRLLRGDHISQNVLKMWQGLPIDQYESLIEGKYESSMLKAGIVFTPAELKAMFGLNDKQVSLYQEFRKATDKSLTNLAVADMLRFGGKDVEPIREAVLESKTVGEAAEMLRDYLLSVAGDNGVLVDTANKMIDKGDKAQDLMDRGYAPLSRFGAYTLDVVDAEGERAYFGMFESAAEASKMRRKMEGLYPGAAITQGTVSEQAYKMFAGVSPETLELFGDMLGLESQGDSAASQAFQEYLKLAKSSRSAMKRLIQRKGIAGFSEDAGRVLAGFVYSNARQTASSLHMGEMTSAANDIDKTQGELKDAAVKLVDYIKTPQEEAQALRGLLFAQYIGGSVASAMVNMTQPLTMTFPWLSQYGGVASAAKQMTSAMKDSGKKTTGDAKLDAALHRAEEDGTVSPQEVHQLMAQSQGRGALQSGDGTRTGDALAKTNNVLSKVGLAWGKLFGVAEQFNRRVTFIAAYRTAVAQGIADPDGFARKAIAETQGVYNKGNKPSWARGAVGSTLFTFKQYSIAYVEMLSRMAGNGPEGKKAALLALAVLFLLSGAGGMPGADDLDDVISGAMQSLGYNFDSKMKRKEFFVGLLGEGGAQFVERGVSGLPGVPIDVSGRMGLGNLIPGTGLFTKKADHTRDVAELAGPAGDFVKRGFDAAGKLITGDVGGAVDSVSPKAIQNLTQAYDMATRGMYRDAKGMKVLDTDGYDALAKAIGFQPNDVKRAQDANFEVTRMIGLNKINETDIANRWAMGVFEKDAAKIQEARDDLAEWNRANPESPIRIDFKQIRSRVQKMNETKAQRISKTAPREIRAAVRQELASAQ